MDVTLFQLLPWGILLFLGMYRLLIYPINQRYQRALNRILAKEIARELYQQIHPDFTYEYKHKPDDLQSQLILSAAMEEFTRINQQEKENIQ